MGRQRIKKRYQVIAIFIITLLFPYLVTMIGIRAQHFDIASPKSCGKYVRIDETTKLDVEQFLLCTLYASVPADYPKEMQKAQLVVMRTWIMGKLGERSEISVEELNIPYVTYSMLEQEWGDNYEKNYNQGMKLVEETNMEQLFYKGERIYPYYHEISEGTTCKGEYEYLQPVSSNEDSSADGFLSIFYFTTEEVKELMKKHWGIELTELQHLTKAQFTLSEGSHYVEKIKIGEKEISGQEFMDACSLSSTSFSVEEFAEGMKIVCKGKGNGKGMSLYGACVMAEQGSDYRDILCHYYTGVELYRTD